VLAISVGTLIASLASPAQWAGTIDIGGRYTPVVFGAMNMASTLGGWVAAESLGNLFDYIENSGANWDLFLWFFVIVYIAGALCWLGVDPDRTVEGTLNAENANPTHT